MLISIYFSNFILGFYLLEQVEHVSNVGFTNAINGSLLGTTSVRYFCLELFHFLQVDVTLSYIMTVIHGASVKQSDIQELAKSHKLGQTFQIRYKT